MNKKIYDIMPPKEETKLIDKPERNSGVLPVKIVDESKAVLAPDFSQNSTFQKPEEKIVKDNQTKSENLSRAPKKRISFSFKKALLISCGIFLIMLLGYLYFSMQKASISIWPKTELVSYNDKITADKSITTIDLENKKIPLELFVIEKDLWQDFPSTGTTQSSGKASGTIKIYNRLNPPSAFSLKSGTHFLSDSGKYFVTSAPVTIPAGTLKGGKITPGSISVKVTAEDVGNDSNIKASKFSIPKLVGTNYYYSIDAESVNPMTGGYSSDVKQVTEGDLDNAKNELSKKVLSEAVVSLKEKISSDYVLFDNAILSTVTETFTPVKVGATVENFSYQVKVKAQALAFKRQDIEKFAKNSILALAFEKSILEKSYKFDFVPEPINLNSGVIVLNSDFRALVYKSINTNDFITILMQKNEVEVKDTIFSRLSNQVERLDVTFWPFWTKKVPTNKDKIKIELRFE